MDASYEIEIENRLNLDGTPVAVRALSFSSPKQTIASVLSESSSVILFESGEDKPSQAIKVNDDPIEISGGGRDQAYVACRASRTVDVIRKSELVDRIALPGEPQAIAWNGSYNSIKQKIMVTCQLPGSEDGLVCVIDEQTLSISNTLKVGKQPRGITLDRQRQHLLVANYGSDSITVIDQMGTKVLATLPTAGRPLAANVSWADPQDIIISLKAGGVLQRMDASRFPPVLSGLTALRKPSEASNSVIPACALPIGEDNLWIVPDRTSESLALVVSNEQELKQIGFYSLGASEPSETGLGQVAISRHGLPTGLCIANRKRKQLLFANMRKVKS
ncbi:MAG: hypothetical protein HRT82_16275 [Henriciella sp.]|nr:hypothetical protein [Henriciella sp.]